jgi:hypothetical protein
MSGALTTMVVLAGETEHEASQTTSIIWGVSAFAILMLALFIVWSLGKGRG